MKQLGMTGWLILAFLCTTCFAADPMEERASQLALALGILTTNQTGVVCNTFVFSSKQTAKAGIFQVKQKRTKGTAPTESISVDIIDTNNAVIATGIIIERSSFESARMALLKKLVLNSMPMPTLIEKFELSQSNVGDLCINEKSFDKTERKYSSTPAALHFVRGGTAVSLCPKNSKNINNIAKAMDDLLIDSAGARKQDQ